MHRYKNNNKAGTRQISHKDKKGKGQDEKAQKGKKTIEEEEEKNEEDENNR